MQNCSRLLALELLDPSLTHCSDGLDDLELQFLRVCRQPWWRMEDCASLEKSDMSDHQLAHCTVPLLQRLEPKLTFQEVAKLRTEPLTLPEWRTGGRAGSRITSRDICRTTPLMQSDKAEQAVELPDDTGRKRRARIPESPAPIGGKNETLLGPQRQGSDGA